MLLNLYCRRCNRSEPVGYYKYFILLFLCYSRLTRLLYEKNIAPTRGEFYLVLFSEQLNNNDDFDIKVEDWSEDETQNYYEIIVTKIKA